jgi:hypothetical protein
MTFGSGGHFGPFWRSFAECFDMPLALVGVGFPSLSYPFGASPILAPCGGACTQTAHKKRQKNEELDCYRVDRCLPPVASHHIPKFKTTGSHFGSPKKVTIAYTAFCLARMVATVTLPTNQKFVPVVAGAVKLIAHGEIRRIAVEAGCRARGPSHAQVKAANRAVPTVARPAFRKRMCRPLCERCGIAQGSLT